MKEGKIHIGTSGWSYKHWKGNFYPENLPQKDWLQFYVDKGFITVELNSPFYHLPYKATFEKWRNSVPKDFLFSVKASRYITHIKKLYDAKESIQKFFDSAKGLNEKLGPVLFQLPPGWKFDKERLKIFLKNLSNKYRYTFEFRNNTWWNDEAFELLKYKNISFCIYELDGKIAPKEITADFVYIRLHGPGKKYQGYYDIKTLSGWADSCIKWKEDGKDIFCYFDNDQNGFAAKNALELKVLTEKSPN